MDGSTTPDEKLKRLLAHLASSSRHAYAAACAPEVAEAVARFHGMRRADQPGRDQLVYRAGAAIEVANGLHLDDYWLLGVLTAPEAFSWLCQVAEEGEFGARGPGASLIELFSQLFLDERYRRYLIHRGAWLRHHWSRTAYRIAVAEFETSVKAIGGSWEARAPTQKQLYAMEQITRTLAAVDPEFRAPALQTRRQAHDWIAAQDGNPRFADDLSPPTLEEFL